MRFRLCHIISELVLVVAFALFIPAEKSVGQSKSFSKAEVYSAYVFNFLKLTEFPEHNSNDLTICLIKPEAGFYAAFKRLESELIRSHKINVIETYAKDSDKACSVIIFSGNLDPHGHKILADGANSRRITIGDDPTFLDSGGIIQLFYEGSKLRFEINLELAEQNNIHFSSKLLGLAKIRPRDKEEN